MLPTSPCCCKKSNINSTTSLCANSSFTIEVRFKLLSEMVEKLGVGHILPLEVMDKCIGRKMWVIMKEGKEFYGTLVAFDEFLNMNMEDCKEYDVTDGDRRTLVTKLESILLNGSHVCLMIPGDN